MQKHSINFLNFLGIEMIIDKIITIYCSCQDKSEILELGEIP